MSEKICNVLPLKQGELVWEEQTQDELLRPLSRLWPWTRMHYIYTRCSFQAHNPFICHQKMSFLFLDEITKGLCAHLPPLSCQRIPMWFAYLLFQDTHTPMNCKSAERKGKCTCKARKMYGKSIYNKHRKWVVRARRQSSGSRAAESLVQHSLSTAWGRLVAGTPLISWLPTLCCV